ncbi:TetR/AcrR family transcriptional regulator [Boseongicola sp. H5]|uniref:TetR/AcrR family transcriptional regulator n=1 Tax=Boseongicola sp. H5 TaxID=2763261 RepID=UPI001D0A3FB1|nr:TetR/AcrR family transcriptional regulator [Boseongicola sp. H5]
MPRKKVLSDDQVLDAAIAVLAEHGAGDFTLADVARKVGLSRATLIQRFENRERILRRLAEREIAATEQYLATLDVEDGLEGLWRFLCTIIESMGTGEHFSVHVLVAYVESKDPYLGKCADRRYKLVQREIYRRLPDVPDRGTLAIHLHTVIAGATMQWVASREGSLSEYVCRQVRLALEIRFPGFSLD